jgi:hypothetical protein
MYTYTHRSSQHTTGELHSQHHRTSDTCCSIGAVVPQHNPAGSCHPQPAAPQRCKGPEVHRRPAHSPHVVPAAGLAILHSRCPHAGGSSSAHPHTDTEGSVCTLSVQTYTHSFTQPNSMEVAYCCAGDRCSTLVPSPSYVWVQNSRCTTLLPTTGELLCSTYSHCMRRLGKLPAPFTHNTYATSQQLTALPQCRCVCCSDTEQKTAPSNTHQWLTTGARPAAGCGVLWGVPPCAAPSFVPCTPAIQPA